MKRVLHKRSNETQSGGPKIPSASTLEYGEIAINYHDGVEKLFIKNDNDKVKTIRTDNQLPPVEKHEDQEFVYRKSVNENEAQSLRFDRIYGKTLAWNQLVNKETVPVTNGTITRTNYIDTIVGGSYAVYNSVYPPSGTPYGHKYYLSLRVAGAGSGSVAFGLNWSVAGREFARFIPTYTTSLARYSAIVQNTSYDANWGDVSVRLYWSNDNLTIDIGNSIVVDLTLMFGAGNEPSTVEEFESMFPENYYDYCGGKLISNDAKAIKTTNNLWDGNVSAVNKYLESNGYEQTGQDNYISSYIEITPGETYRLVNNDTALGNMASICFYDSSKSYVSGYNYSGSSSFQITAPTGTKYCRFSMCSTPLNREGFLFKIDDGIQYNNTVEDTTLINLDTIEVYSHNLWDEEYTLTGLKQEDGTPDSGTTWFTSKNFIEVKPNMSYYFRYYGNNYNMKFCFYDKNKAYIGYTNGNIGNRTFVTPNNCYYVKFNFDSSYGTTYNNDICLNVNSSFNGQYEPHGILTIEGGLKGVGSIHDEILGNKFIKKFERVDLGSLTWAKGTSYDYGRCFYTIINGMKVGVSGYITICCSGLPTKGANDINPNSPTYLGYIFELFGLQKPGVAILSNEYTDAAEVKAAMNGVLLDYPFETPIEYDLVNPIHPVVKSGTIESRISPNPDGLSAPMVADISYTQTSEYILGELDSKLGDIETLLETI